MRLYQFPLSPNCQKVVALAHEVGVPLESVHVDLFKGETKRPEILAKNPNGRVPILEDGDFVLWESNAILGYIAAKADRSDLAPATPRERADVDRWLLWHNAHFGPAIRMVAFERIVKKLGGLGPPDENVVQTGIREFATTAAVLDTSLADKTYLCGRLTIADFAMATHAGVAKAAGLDVASHPNLARWLGGMLERDSFKKTLAAAHEPIRK